jgi:putative membrane protein
MTRALLSLTALLVTAAPSSSAPARTPDVDSAFVRLATQANAGEIDMARLALRRSSADEARMFADSMIDDHERLAKALAALAPVPRVPRISELDRLAMLRLSAIAPADFDQQYLMQQVGDHLAAISLYSSEAQEGRNPQLRNFAGRQLPLLRAHLQQAVEGVAHVGGSSPFKQH